MNDGLETAPGADRTVGALLWGAAALLVVALYAANVWLGRLNQDEGWYLYAAHQVAAGQWPGRDFFFTQGPVMPWVYGRLAAAWAPLGVAGGRGLTALLGLSGAALAAMLAARLTPRSRRAPAAWSAFVLAGVNVYHGYFTTIPKTYALTAVWVLGGLLALAAVRDRRPRAGLWAAVSGCLLACAAGTRFSFVLMPAIGGGWLLWRRQRFGWAWAAFAAAGLATLVLFFAPAGPAGWRSLRFVFGFHAAREGGRGLQALMLAGGSLSRWIQAYYAMLVLGLGAGLCFRLRRSPGGVREPTIEGPLLCMLGAVFLLQWLSPHPYDDYQVPLMPAAAACIAAAFWRGLPSPQAPGGLGLARSTWIRAALLLLVAAQAFASPLLQDWFVVRQDRFWVQMKDEPDLARLQRVGRWIREHSRPDQLLLTQDLYLAVEARRRVPPGFEMGPFCFFPDLDDDRAAALHVLNARGMAATIHAADAPLAAVSGYGFAIAAPSMRPLGERERADWLRRLSARYRPVLDVEDFGQQHTTLTLWTRRDHREDPES